MPGRYVYKYEVPVADLATIDMPKYAKPLRADLQNGTLVVWALIDPLMPTVKHRFRIAGTGHNIEYRHTVRRTPTGYVDGYVSTFYVDGLVFHVFHNGEVD